MHYRRRRSSRLPLLFFAAALLAALLVGTYQLKNLSTQIAVSDAADMVTATVNKVVCDLIDPDVYDLEYFVHFERDGNVNVTAISGNMAHINELSSQILNMVIESTDTDPMIVKIPLGSLLGSNLLMGKGPDVSVEISMLTSSRVDFKSKVEACGINQTNYRLYLEVVIDVDVLIPWGTESATVLTEVLVADTVIVGKVPETYFNVEK